MNLALIFILIGSACAEETVEPVVLEVSPKVEGAVARGHAFLASQQNRDGSWSSGAYPHDVGITALSLMAFLAGGHLPDEGKYAVNVSQGLSCLLKTAQRDGYIASDESRMYGHGFATLCLAEAYGMSPQFPELGQKLRNAVELILRSQKPDGGWRYLPARTLVSDLSVTVCQIQALRAARNAGIKVPKEAIDQAAEYIKRCANPDGSFRYMPQEDGSSVALTGGAVTALYGTGDYHTRVLLSGVDYLRNYARLDFRRTNYYFYAHYYCVQAMFQAGGENWRTWFPKIQDDLLAQQREDGGWKGDEIGPVYGTAMALIILQVPGQYLPIFQR
jgi:hypothetical protein